MTDGGDAAEVEIVGGGECGTGAEVEDFSSLESSSTDANAAAYCFNNGGGSPEIIVCKVEVCDGVAASVARESDGSDPEDCISNTNAGGIAASTAAATGAAAPCTCACVAAGSLLLALALLAARMWSLSLIEVMPYVASSSSSLASWSEDDTATSPPLLLLLLLLPLCSAGAPVVVGVGVGSAT